ncbi:ATP-binding protein [Streptomyces argyrophylli]|uniref:Sensor histidine kinase n=1 Tax=Streptomyces argyrophylli TaxID=2726118 RepID=A0A6M4PFG5_9ACTN|nr:ATP-binding protein [Streptomyces argyrophyllae]QJS09915.1 sensor histidine kinase [Streptomyces argyrophyllae]
MSAPVTVSACPLSTGEPQAPPPSPAALAYSLTLPAGPTSPRVARAAARVVLQTHGLADMMDPVVQVVAELVACAWKFAPGSEVYVSLRYRDGDVRAIVYDGHPRHTHPRLAAACDTRRRAALRVLGCVVRACEGEWGFGEAREPGGGTRMWAVVPWRGARTYAGLSVR